MPTQKTKSIPDNGTSELVGLELTQKQVRALSRLLPVGFTLGQAAKSASKKVSSQPTKKVFTSEGVIPAPQAKPKQIINPNDILINKNALRHPEKRKLSYHLEHKYPDYEPIPMTSSKSNKANNDALRKCYNLVQKLKKHPASSPFLLPVDTVALGLFDYYDIVKEPMDLGTVENKLKHGYYLTAIEFAEDVRRIWNNSFLYNMNGSPIYYMTAEMSTFFEKSYKDVESLASNDTVRELEKKVEMLTRQISQINQTVSSPVPLNLSRAKSSGGRSHSSIKFNNKPLTIQEKQQLGQTIPLLSPEHLRGVWDIVSQGMAPSGNDNEEMVFDIEKLPVDVARELQRYVKHKMSLMNRAKNRSKAKEVALLREASVTSVNYKHQDGDFDNGFKGEDELTTQHHSVTGSDGKPDQGDLNVRDDVSVNSSESSFISDSDSDGEEPKQHHHHRHNKESLRVLP